MKSKRFLLHFDNWCQISAQAVEEMYLPGEVTSSLGNPYIEQDAVGRVLKGVAPVALVTTNEAGW